MLRYIRTCLCRLLLLTYQEAVLFANSSPRLENDLARDICFGVSTPAKGLLSAIGDGFVPSDSGRVYDVTIRHVITTVRNTTDSFTLSTQFLTRLKFCHAILILIGAPILQPLT